MTLPGDAFRDRKFIDWIISDKSGQGSLADDYQDLMIRRHEANTQGKIGGANILAARDEITIRNDADRVLDAQLRQDAPEVGALLSRLAGLYGAEQLKSMSDRELYALYKRHALNGSK